MPTSTPCTSRGSLTFLAGQGPSVFTTCRRPRPCPLPKGRTHLGCSGVVGHRRQLHVLDLDVAALERRAVHPRGSRVRRSHGYQLSPLQHLQTQSRTASA